MQEQRFRIWLSNSRGLGENTAGSRLSNCKRVEAHEGNLDKLWEIDGLASLINRLTYSREDERSGRPPKHRVPINGDIYIGTATLRTAVLLYREFRSPEEQRDGSRRAASKKQPRQRRVRQPAKDWPVWPQPNDDDLLDLAHSITAAGRFLDPRIVGAVAVYTGAWGLVGLLV